MREIARIRGGKCLSNIYINSKTNHRWKCSEGHQWEATPNNVRKGTWCSYCAGKAKLTIEQMQELAKQRGGKCLSKVYINKASRLLWECDQGHQWEASPGSVKRGNWCPHCSGTARLSIGAMHQLSQRRGGRCLSSEYINTKTNLLWECSKGHRWEAAPNNVKNGSWCPICSAKRRAESRKLDITQMRQVARERGGKCLSNIYVDSKTKLLWECAVRHRWSAAPTMVKQGTWCPECSAGLGERICREYFEQLFGHQFIKSYPKWLVNSRGNQMELDGYCQSLGLAFEHQGRQHYSTNSIFISSYRHFQTRQKDDKRKRKLCERNGVVLIEVPEIPTILPIEEVKCYIKEKCELKGALLPNDYDSKDVKLGNALINLAQVEALRGLHEIAQRKAGKCLSKEYINAFTPVLWECGKGHQWLAPPSRIRNGHWCKKCGIKKGSESRKDNIEEMNRIASLRRGKCLSQEYVSSGGKLLWQCVEGHNWEAAPRDIKSGHWCKKCGDKKGSALRKLGIDKMREIADERYGKCLSKKYVNNKTKLLWEYAEGHQWKAIPSNVLRGSWCPKCYTLNRTSSAKDVKAWI